MEEKQTENQVMEEAAGVGETEGKEDGIKHCFHEFVRFKGYRRCIKCGMEIDK